MVGSVGGGPMRLFLNRFPVGNRVRVQLIGTKSNRMGVGSRLTATIDGRKVIRDVFPVNGFMGQSPVDPSIGMGSDKVIDQLEVRWPTGQVQTFKNISAGGLVVITEGQSEFEKK